MASRPSTERPPPARAPIARAAGALSELFPPGSRLLAALPPRAVKLWAALAATGFDHGAATHRDLEAMAGCCHTTARLSLEDLRKAGVLEVVRAGRSVHHWRLRELPNQDSERAVAARDRAALEMAWRTFDVTRRPAERR